MVSVVDDGIFWISFVTLITACCLAVIKITYKSKCREVECCCIKIRRDIEQEEKIDEMEINSIRRLDSMDNIPKFTRSQNQL